MFVLLIILTIVSFLIQWRLKSKFEEYSQIRLHSNISGAEAAQQMLYDHGITNVRIMSVEGQLSDHYNPQDRTVNLSHDVYYGRNAAAVAVAAHEVGHAVQHATAYSFLQFRSAMVPALSVANTWMPWLLMGGVLLLQVTPMILIIGVVLFAATTLFSFITLPVEFDASARALRWVKQKNIVTDNEYAMSRSALNLAASTYVIAAISSLATLLYYVMMLSGRNRD